MEKILGQILDEIKDLKTEVKTIKDEVKTVKDEVKAVKDEVKTIKDEVKAVKDEVKTVRDLAESTHDLAQNTHNAVVRLELVEVPKIQAALDGYSMNHEKLSGQEERIIRLEDTTEQHSIEIALLKAK